MSDRRPANTTKSPPGLARLGLALALAGALFVVPASADWLVTLDGDQIETQGPWSIQGKLVVFTSPGGGLSSLRLADIDVDASDQLTAASRAGQHRPRTEQPAREATFVLTDNDVSHVDGRLEGSMEDRKEAGAEARAETIRTTAATEDGVSVTDWDQSFDDNINGVVVTGRIENRSRDIQTEVTLQVVLHLIDGTLAGRAPATLQKQVLNPKGSTSFKATFPGTLSFDRPDFQIDSVPLVPRVENDSEPAG
ncbi:MAG: hypothetical protein WBG93_12775 [Thermoanaerobaculia bacterium]